MNPKITCKNMGPETGLCGPWAKAHGPPQSLRFRGPGRAQAGETKNQKLDFLKKNGTPYKGYFKIIFGNFCPSVPMS